MQDLRTGLCDGIHISRLPFYDDPSLDEKAIMSHVLSSETGMTVQKLLRLVRNPEGFHVLVRWKGLPSSDDTLEPLRNVYEDVPAMLKKLLERKTTPTHLANDEKQALEL